METYGKEFQQNIDYKKILYRFLEFKKLIIACVIIALISAFIYNNTTNVLYSNNTSILISEKDQNILGGGEGFMQGMSMFGTRVNMDNEVEMLGTFSIVKETVQRLDLKASIYEYNKTLLSDVFSEAKFIKKNELYENSPIKIIVDPTQAQATYLPFYIEIIDDNTFNIKTVGDDIYLYNYIDDIITEKVSTVFFENNYKFGEEIATKYFNFQIVKTNFFNKDYTQDKKLFFILNNSNFLAGEFKSELVIEPISEAASIINISLTGTNFNKITEFLNMLTIVFLDHNLDKKNNSAASTVSFIDSQISEFKDSLSTAENNLKQFRTSNQVMDLSFQGQQVFTKLEQLETEKANLQTQQRYYVYLNTYFSRNPDVTDLMAPSSMNVVDPILTSLVTQLITLNSDRVSITRNNPNSDNILLKDLNIKIENLKKTIKENVESSVKTINASMNELNYRIQKLSGQISTMPKTELQLRGIERKFELNSTIYTFLLQKRSEAQIAKASSMPDYEVVEPARFIRTAPVAPKKSLNLAIAMFLGLILPIGFVLAIDFFNNHLTDIDEIELLANNPVLGKIFHNFRKTNLVVAHRPNSSVTESFRSTRTNFQFFDPSGKKQVIVLTSSTSGDGKTFCAINFASVLALNGHKTVVLEFDLRRPKIHQEFGSSNMIGITSFLIDKAVIDDIIVPTEVPNLDLISAGPAAPNPAELIASERTAEFIETLKEMYDYIIIDSAPVGIVSETYLLMKYSDVNIFVVRLGHTIRDAFKNALKGMKNNGFSNFSMLINDMDIRKESYKHGYDNKYYSDNEKGFFKKLFSRKKSA